jgi:hypothetical protein
MLLLLLLLLPYLQIPRLQTQNTSNLSSTTTTTQLTQSSNSCSVNLSIALECLQRTKPSIVLEYPNDPIEHFNEIRNAMLPWAQHHGDHHYHEGINYNGPWIENYWISHFEALWNETTSSNNNNNDTTTNASCISDYFGPFIPIFVPWVDQLINHGNRYPSGMVEAFLSVLRPNVPYVTVSQCDIGITYDQTIDMRSIPNLLVFSAGGYGHVPIPLLKQDEARNNDLDVANRTIGISYVGSLVNEPHGMRQQMHDDMLLYNESASNFFVYEYYYGEDWKHVMRNSRFSLVPRGYGRSAYHLMETVQMGLVPVYVYYPNDVPWVPYADLFQEIGYVTDAASLPNLIQKQLQHVTLDEIRRREQQMETIRTSHFSYEGVLDHIGHFLIGATNDLRCQALPPSVVGLR